ncbi:MAG: 30S ribosomal protein S15 [Candidatus Bathyarchaeia archaeon]
MARLFTSKRGKSGSTRPISKKSPSWCKYLPEEVEALVVKLAKQGNTPSMIGNILRDRYGIPLVKPLTGKSISEILRESKLSPSIPEDLQVLLGKAESLAKHLQKNRQDHVNKHSLTLIESKIHRLVNYYKARGVLPQDWKYTPAAASVE